MSIYLDYNATTPIDPRVLDVMIDVYKNAPGNADSRTHGYGEKTRKITEASRKQVANLISVAPEEVFFTSGATESNNISIQGLREYSEKTGKKHIITTSIEHKSVLNTVKYLGEHGYDVELVDPDLSGRVSVENILRRVRDDTLLVAVMHINNETGIIQPVKEIGDALYEQNIFFHIDATQSCGKLVDEIRNLHYDMLSMSAHKLRGPQGIGTLVLRRKNYKLPPVRNVFFGGQQEHGIRPGTIPVALVAGMGKACEIASQEYSLNNEHNKKIKEEILKMVEESGVRYHINGDPHFCIDTTLNICFDGVASEALMLITKQYCALSNGSACNSKSYEPSFVLTAMGIPEDKIGESVRISWGSGVDIKSVKENFSKLMANVKAIA